MLEFSWSVMCLVVLSAATLPVGLGAAVLGWNRGHPLLQSGLPYSLLAASLWLLGVTLFAVAHTVLAKLGADFNIANATLIGLAGVGLLLLAVAPPTKRPSMSDTTAFAILFVVNILIKYVYQFYWLSSYPFGDLFQEVHTFGAVSLYRDTAQLDFMTTTSYIPLRQALYTAYYAAFGISPIAVYWYLPVSFSLVSTLLAWGLPRALGLRGPCQWTVAGPLSLALGLLVVTNGTVLGAVSLALMGILLHVAAGTPLSERRSHFIILVGLAAVAVVIDTILNRLELKPILLPIAVAATSIIYISKGIIKGMSTHLLAVTLACAGIALHRGSTLFLPTVLLSVAILHLFEFVVAHHDGPRMRRTIGVALLALGLLSLVFPVFALLEEMRLVAIGSRLIEIYSFVTTIIVGEPIRVGSDLMLGTGPRVALIEMVRIVGPSAAVMIGLVAIAAVVMRYFIRSSDSKPLSKLDLTAAWAWAVATSLMILIGSGLPFVYRIGHLMLAVLTMAMALFALEMRRLYAWRRLPLPVLVAASVGLCTFAVLYITLYSSQSRLSSSEVTPYLRLTAPYVLSVALGSFGTLIAAVVLRRRAYALALCVFSIALTIQADQKGMTSVFLRYSFGTPPSRVDWISFYSKSEVDLMMNIASVGQPWVVVSDPLTVSVARTFGGAMSAYNYSNLDTVSTSTRARVQKLIRSVLDIDETSSGDLALARYRVCISLLSDLVSIPSVDIVQRLYDPQEIMKRSRVVASESENVSTSYFTTPESSAAETGSMSLELSGPIVETDLGKRLLGGADRKPWRLVMIVTPRTVRWLESSATDPSLYFPLAGDVRPALQHEVVRSPFPIIEQTPEFLVFEITCPLVRPITRTGADRP